jgi:hypothetical protein
MKSIIVSLFFVFLTNILSAQTTDPIKTEPEIIPSKRNEIGILASPIGIVLLGGTPSGQRFGISYKRNNQKKYLFTTGIYFQNEHNSFLGNNYTLEIIGNRRNIQFNNNQFNKGSISVGIERRWPMKSKPALTKFLGMELTSGYSESNQHIGSQWMELDTVNTGGNPGQEIYNPVGEITPLFITEKKSIHAGMAFNAGLQLTINKRFYAMAQICISLEMAFQNISESDKVTLQNNSFKATSFDFNQRGPIGDIGLYYRF